jgi:hypothetical protein
VLPCSVVESFQSFQSFFFESLILSFPLFLGRGERLTRMIVRVGILAQENIFCSTLGAAYSSIVRDRINSDKNVRTSFSLLFAQTESHVLFLCSWNTRRKWPEISQVPRKKKQTTTVIFELQTYTICSTERQLRIGEHLSDPSLVSKARIYIGYYHIYKRNFEVAREILEDELERSKEQKNDGVRTSFFPFS